MIKNNFTRIFNNVSKEFDQNLKKYGNSPRSTGQRNLQTQERRMLILMDVGNLKNAKILDFGCGTGYLYSLLKKKINFKGEYVGYDISNGMINFAQKKHKKARFEKKNIFYDTIHESFDYILINGTFNSQIGKNFFWIKKCLKILFKKTRKAIAFNNLTSYVDYFDKKLYYVEPEKIFSFCKLQLSPLVTLRHNYHIKKKYPPYEFTTYVYKTRIKIRKSLL